jgi:hypothetical protein
MSFRITGLSAEPFQHLFGLSEEDLAKHNVKRYVADEKPGFPCRVGMRDANPGESVLLLNHTYQPANTPYQGTHAIFVIVGASLTYDCTNRIPDVMRVRLLSLRGFDNTGMMLDADVVEGARIEQVIERMFANPDVSYIQVHNAKRGCYSGRIDRA